MTAELTGDERGCGRTAEGIKDDAGNRRPLHGRGHDGKRDASQSSPKQPPGSQLALLAAVTMNRPVPAFSRVPGVGHFLSPPRLDAPRLSDPWRSRTGRLPRSLVAHLMICSASFCGQVAKWASGKPSVAIVQTEAEVAADRNVVTESFGSLRPIGATVTLVVLGLPFPRLAFIGYAEPLDRAKTVCLPHRLLVEEVPRPLRKLEHVGMRHGRAVAYRLGSGFGFAQMFKPLQYHPSARRVKAKRRGSRLSLWV